MSLRVAGTPLTCQVTSNGPLPVRAKLRVADSPAQSSVLLLRSALGMGLTETLRQTGVPVPQLFWGVTQTWPETEFKKLTLTVSPEPVNTAPGGTDQL